MLDSITGHAKTIRDGAAVITVGGVGIRVDMPTRDLARLDGEVTVFTVLQVREETVHLYGFCTERGRELFYLLTSVSGVGPKAALAVLSYHGNEALERAIATSDSGALELVSGVGKKTAGRIVLELKDKIGAVAEKTEDAPASSSAVAEVREGLKGLGYSPHEIAEALADLPPDGDAPTLLRHALRTLGRERAGVGGPAGDNE